MQIKVTMIGSGNVATLLGRKIKLAGHIIMQVFSRNVEHAWLLAEELGCEYTSAWDLLKPDADLYILALPDQALYEIGQHLSIPQKMVVHTAGSVNMDVLKTIGINYGVLYPLQSLNKGLKLIPRIPFLVDANTVDGLVLLQDFAGTLSDNVQSAGDEQRLKLHVASVLVNNFPNHLYALAEFYCRQEKLEFTWLMPLIEETVNRMPYISPSKSQTGPAVRNDVVTLDRHRYMLEKYDDIDKIYELMTESIQHFQRKDR